MIDADTIRKEIMDEPAGARLDAAFAWIEYLAPKGQPETREIALKYGLSPMQSEIMRLLTRSMGVIVPMDTLSGLCRDEAEDPVGSIKVHICHLRKALRYQKCDIEIVTVSKLGYYAKPKD